MAIYAISDLHLSLKGIKPMDIFGEIWHNHPEKIAENWDAMVAPEDTVLIAGDHSWELRFDGATADLEWIANRPGAKLMIRGNHDYWWRREATSRIQQELPESIRLLHGRGIVVEGIGITGTRGWRVELDDDPDAGDERVMRRELMYLERGLSEIPKDVERKIVMLHYPPFDADLELNQFAEIIEAHSVDLVIYGHIHTGYYLEGDYNGVEYKLVSVDHTDMKPVLIS